jgi:hypothetical protein
MFNCTSLQRNTENMTSVHIIQGVSQKNCTVRKFPLNCKFRKICENFMQAWIVWSIFTIKIISESKFSSAGGLFLKTILKMACAHFRTVQFYFCANNRHSTAFTTNKSIII